jgi:hypothetical protein
VQLVLHCLSHRGRLAAVPCPRHDSPTGSAPDQLSQEKIVEGFLSFDSQKTTTKLIVSADFKVEGSCVEVGPQRGWRITLTPRDCMAREYWVHDGLIHHALPQSPPPWNHHTNFIVGAEVKRIEPEAKDAIFEALEEWSRGISPAEKGGVQPIGLPGRAERPIWPLRFCPRRDRGANLLEFPQAKPITDRR